VAGPGIAVRLELLPLLTENSCDGGQLAVDPVVVLAVDAEDRRADAVEGRGVRIGAVADDGRLEVRVVGRVPERLPRTDPRLLT
jgi:hypothetical protein